MSLTSTASAKAEPSMLGRLFARQELALLVCLILVLVFFSATVENFLSVRNMTNVLGQASLALTAGIGCAIVFISGEVDISIGSLLATVAGIILAARVGSAQHTAGLNFEFQVVAATVLGGVSLAGGIGSLTGMALGVLILQFLSNGLRGLGLPTEWQLVITGMIIIAAVAFDEAKRGRAIGG